jgi:hypothetical protein
MSSHKDKEDFGEYIGFPDAKYGHFHRLMIELETEDELSFRS